VQALCAHRTTLSMDVFVARLQSGDLPHDAVAFTFDDGYIDNLLRAKPILEAAGVSATVFLTTGLIGMGNEFWWDELARMVLLRAEPLSVSLTVEGDRLKIDLPPIDPELEPRVAWRAWKRPVTARERAYRTLWRTLWNCAAEPRNAAMERLRRIFDSAAPCNPEDLPMGVEDVRRLVSDRVSIGAHGRYHEQLTSLPAAARFEEIQRSRVDAEALSALPVTGFAYPYGACNAEIADMARRAGYRWACSKRGTTIGPEGVDLYDLPRIAIGNWRADVLLAKLDARQDVTAQR
jgi:peptidoglycan/xylan/chitin deacetylase (PgdA/CDA1 family)